LAGTPKRVKNGGGSAARDPIEVENSPEVSEVEDSLFFDLLFSLDGTYSCGKGVPSGASFTV